MSAILYGGSENIIDVRKEREVRQLSKKLHR